MKYVRQFGIIVGISLAGELLRYIIPLPIPASIYGLVLMLSLLMTKIVPLEAVKGTATFLIDIMAIMFIPAGVGLLTSWGDVREIWLPLMVIIVVTTILVMVVTGRVTQYVIIKEEKKKEDRKRGET